MFHLRGLTYTHLMIRDIESYSTFYKHYQINKYIKI